MDLMFLFRGYFFRLFDRNVWFLSVSKNMGIDTNVITVILVKSDILVTFPENCQNLVVLRHFYFLVCGRDLKMVFIYLNFMVFLAPPIFLGLFCGGRLLSHSALQHP